MKLSALKKNRKGFTLIELMVVIAILAALAAIGYGPIVDHMNDGDRQKAMTNMKTLHTMLQGFKKVVCDCSRGAPVSELKGNIVISAVRAAGMKK